jgi:hypothetical protein
MSLTLVPTSVHRYLKLPQYVEETTFGTTQSSATFVDASIINSTRTTYANATEMYRKLGKRTMFKYLKMGTDLTWSCSFSPVDTALMRYASENGNALGTATGTIDKSLTFVNSAYRNTPGSNGPLVETYVLRKGSKCDSMTVTTTSRGMVTVDMDWISSTITTSTSANGGLTTPTFVASPTTATPWSNLTGGTSKLTIGGVVYPFKTASFTVNNNLDAVDLDGSDAIAWLEPTTKEVTFTCELLIQKDLALETQIDAGTGVAASLVLNSTGPKTATFTNLFLNNKSEDDDSGETTVKTATYSGSAEDVTISA